MSLSSTSSLLAPLASFRDKPFEERLVESVKLHERFPDRVPVICESAGGRGSTTPTLDKNRFLVPQDLTVSQLVYVLRKRLCLPADQALFLYCGGTLPPTTLLVRELYSAWRDPDGFLYIQYAGEAAFGC
jgi:GABA(A) receptor-associated protein